MNNSTAIAVYTLLGPETIMTVSPDPIAFIMAGRLNCSY